MEHYTWLLILAFESSDRHMSYYIFRPCCRERRENAIATGSCLLLVKCSSQRALTSALILIVCTSSGYRVNPRYFKSQLGCEARNAGYGPGESSVGLWPGAQEELEASRGKPRSWKLQRKMFLINNEIIYPSIHLSPVDLFQRFYTIFWSYYFISLFPYECWWVNVFFFYKLFKLWK